MHLPKRGGRKRIGLLGGSFNPAHVGHVHISLEALKRLKLDEIWWLVSPRNPFKCADDLADYATRLAYARALVSHPRIRVLDIEAQHGLYYTVETLRYLKAHYPSTPFVWLMGADNLAHFHRWKSWNSLAQSVPIAVLDRAPYGLRALHSRFAQRYDPARIAVREAAALADSFAPAWLYLTIPRHPLSATHLRKTLGTEAFLRHTECRQS